MTPRKQIRIIKKVRERPGAWRFISLLRNGSRYVWDPREGVYYLEWWDGPKRRRESAGRTPSEALEAQRRKRNELIGQVVAGSRPVVEAVREGTSLEAGMPIATAREIFLDHVRVHSPEKPRTLRRYGIVLDHFKRHLGVRRFVEAVTRTDIDDYKAARSRERSQQHRDRIIAPRTINFEISVLRTFFYFLINERGVRMTNPCARFKPLRDPRQKARRKPPTYSEAEMERLFAVCSEFERAVFAAFLLTGMREQELCWLSWPDVKLREGRAAVTVTGEGKPGFSPKDYEERVIPIPDELARILQALPQDHRWVFPTAKGRRHTHLLRRLKQIAFAAEVEHATLHRFRHTYATRLLESGCDIVTVQRLMGHSDIDTTRQYLNPGEELQRRAVGKLSLKGLG